MTVYDEDNFMGRVNYAADCISRGRAIGSRHFDTCFEMLDGDAVVVALQRRAEKNPKLHAGILRYFTSHDGGYPIRWQQAVRELAHLPTRQLKDAAARQRMMRHAS